MKRALLISLSLIAGAVQAARLKDIAAIKGMRDNQLLGYGLVVGLQGTGDSKKEFTGMAMSQMLRQMGVDVKADQIESKNVAAVIVTANLPAFIRAGSRLDVTVSSIGDSKSLQGGTLLMTPLRGPDKNVYAVAQGPLSVGGFAGGGGGASVTKNHPTVGLVPNGAIVEKEVPVDFSNRNALRLALHNADFTTAARVAKTINQELGGLYARARDAATIDVIVPYDHEGGAVELIALVERLPVEQDTRAKVIINERTGTIVVGEAVRVSTVAVAHGNLTLEIKAKETAKVETARDPLQPEDGAMKQTQESVKETTVSVNEPGDKLISVPEGATLGDVVKALNALGVTPRDLIGILQAMKAQGALQAELEIL
jgi:flagellar P-ring protein precursor FlgI